MKIKATPSMCSNSLKNHLEFVVLWYTLLELELQLIWCQEKKGLCELENRKLILRLIFCHYGSLFHLTVTEIMGGLYCSLPLWSSCSTTMWVCAAYPEILQKRIAECFTMFGHFEEIQLPLIAGKKLYPSWVMGNWVVPKQVWRAT